YPTLKFPMLKASLNLPPHLSTLYTCSHSLSLYSLMSGTDTVQQHINTHTQIHTYVCAHRHRHTHTRVRRLTHTRTHTFGDIHNALTLSDTHNRDRSVCTSVEYTHTNKH